MWDYFVNGKKINLSESFYVGDAAGRTKNPRTKKKKKKKKDFSCGDRMFAAT